MIRCPLCGAKTRVLETRATAACARRRRGCRIVGCDGKLTTVEIAVPDGHAADFAARLREFIGRTEGDVQ